MRTPFLAMRTPPVLSFIGPEVFSMRTRQSFDLIIILFIDGIKRATINSSRHSV